MNGKFNLNVSTRPFTSNRLGSLRREPIQLLKHLSFQFLLVFMGAMSLSFATPPSGCAAEGTVIDNGEGLTFVIECIGSCATQSCEFVEDGLFPGTFWCGCSQIESACCHLIVTGGVIVEGSPDTVEGSGYALRGSCLGCSLSGTCTAVRREEGGQTVYYAECL